MKIGETITVVDLGGAKIVAVTALCIQTGRFELLAKEEEPTNGAVRRGVVTDPKIAGEKLYNIILRLKATLARRKEVEIRKIHVLIGGMSLRSVTAECTLNIGGEYKVSADDLNELNNMEPEHVLQAGEKVYASRNLGFFTDGELNENPLDVCCNLLSKRTDCLVGSTRIEESLREAFTYVKGIDLMTIILHRDALSRLYFKGHETEDIVLVDIGEGATSVAIHQGSTPRHYEVIPLGGSSITHDIASAGIDIATAERMKCESGHAKLNLNREDTTLLPNLSSHKLDIIIEARMTEILQNVREVITRSGVSLREMREGIVFTGGSSLLTNFWELAKELFPETSVRPMNYDRYPFEKNADLGLFEMPYTSILGAILWSSGANETVATVEKKRIVMEEATLNFDDFPTLSSPSSSGQGLDYGQQIENILKNNHSPVDPQHPNPAMETTIENNKLDKPEKEKKESNKEKKNKRHLFKGFTDSIANIFEDEPRNKDK